MKKYQTTAAILLAFFTMQVSGQSTDKHPGPAGKQLEITNTGLEISKLRDELSQAKKAAEKAAEAARSSAEANRIVAKKLAENPSDQQLSSQATDLARKAQKDARASRKAADNQARLEKRLTDLELRMAENQAFVEPYPVSLADSQAVRPVAEEPVVTTPAAPEVAKGPSNEVTDAESTAGIVGKVIGQTYHRYPQTGQPAIIINNIVVPPDYNQAARVVSGQPAAREFSEEDVREYQAFKMWLEERKATGRRGYDNAPGPLPVQATPAPAETAQKLTFTQRFGEVNRKRSGMWVIPVVGLHASNFDADFSNDKVEGRSGWNAGLDFRAHQKRFFIQPGVHYFSSSMEVSSKDSLSNAPFLKGPRIHSLKVPLLLGFYLTRESGSFLKINVKGGVAGNYVISVDKNSLARFSKDNMEEFSYGLNAGLGIELGLLTIDVSHEWGMSPLFKDDRGKSNILRATLGIKI